MVQARSATKDDQTWQFDVSATYARMNLEFGAVVSMPTYVTREEFEARVGVLEREVEGEKLVTPGDTTHS